MPQSLIQALDNIVRADLLKWRDMWFDCLVASTIVVAVGLGLEYFELREELKHLRLDRRDRQMFFKPTPHEIAAKWKVLAFAGWVLIVVGVVCEIGFETMVSLADSKVQTFNDTLLEDTRREAMLAVERAAGLEKEAAAENLARVKTRSIGWMANADGF